VAQLRIHRGYIPGAIGRVAQLQGKYYAEHWSFGAPFEARVARELAAFVESYDAERDGLWLAMRDDVIEGSVAIMSGSPARLRWFIVSDELRGKGMGRELVTAAMDFCRGKRYPVVELPTFRGLDAARHLYEEQGFRLVEEREGDQYGATVMEQLFRWEIGSPPSRG
jgi:GNAT superfamily N-acetyltransferase